MSLHYVIQGLNQTNFKGDVKKFLDVVFDNKVKLDCDLVKPKGGSEATLTIFLANADFEVILTAEEEPKFKGYTIKVGKDEGEFQMSSVNSALKALKKVLDLHNDYISSMLVEMDGLESEEEEEKPKSKTKTKSKTRGKK